MRGFVPKISIFFCVCMCGCVLLVLE
ncbi:hypothetical protein Avbf_04306 [Armadillidium vulgare]|nr:hypothetical protein Avbf_04306 [Armadillidium vulgare]